MDHAAVVCRHCILKTNYICTTLVNILGRRRLVFQTVSSDHPKKPDDIGER